jgi:hypothetical protein
MESLINQYRKTEKWNPEGSTAFGEPNEDIANFIESMANGRLTVDELKQAGFDYDSFLTLLNRAFEIDTLRNTPPTSGLSGLSIKSGGTINTVVGDVPVSNPASGTITVLARNSDATKLYISIDRGGFYDYGWVKSDDVTFTKEQLNSLPHR